MYLSGKKSIFCEIKEIPGHWILDHICLIYLTFCSVLQIAESIDLEDRSSVMQSDDPNDTSYAYVSIQFDMVQQDERKRRDASCSESKQTYSCEYCWNTVVNKYNFKRHILRGHARPDNIFVAGCLIQPSYSRVFLFTFLLTKHKTHVHPKKLCLKFVGKLYFFTGHEETLPNCTWKTFGKT